MIKKAIVLLTIVSLVLGEELSWARTKCGPADQITQWGAKIDPKNILPEYPRPQLTRPDNTWKNLNGIWQWQAASNANEQPPFGKNLSATILVPFAVESCLSGIGKNYEYMWYRLLFDKPTTFTNSKSLLHFVAVDWQSKVWLNTKYIGEHQGGYDRFEYDISADLKSTNNELIVFVYDPSDSGPQPQGKQRVSAITDPGGDSYTPASGIWGSVWLENVPTTYIHELRMTTTLKSLTITTFVKPGSTAPEQGYDTVGGDLQQVTLKTNDYYTGCFELCRRTSGCVGYSFGIPLCGGLTAPTCWLKSSITNRTQNDCRISGQINKPVTVEYKVLDGSSVVATASGKSGDAVVINIPSPKLWGPKNPFLYKLSISIDGDVVGSYFGLRTVSLGKFQHPGGPATGVQNGTDRPGGDLPGSPYTISQADPSICDNDCKNKPGCNSWAYAVPNCDGFSKPTCWLKSAVHPYPGPAKCRASGAMAYEPYTASRLLLNEQPVFLAAWLDQSWWPDGIYTAPTDEALAFDLKSLHTFGLNSVRLHQKVNPERWYYYADVLGIVVMQDMIQKFGGATEASIPIFTTEFYRMIGNQYNHPSIIQWEIFNEGDCVTHFDAPKMVQIARDLDPTRLIDTNSGGPANDLHIADVNDIHTYPYPGFPQFNASQYGMIGEFGGIGAFIKGKEWVAGKCGTYLQVDTPQAEADTYVKMVQQIIARKDVVSVCVYTQISDVERECDGFLNYDRTNKFNAAQTDSIAAINQKLIG